MTSSSARFADLQRKYEENPRRFFAPLANELRRSGNARRAAEICREYLAHLPEHLSGHVVLANGTSLVLVSHEMTTGIVRVDGLDEEIAIQPFDPLQVHEGNTSLARSIENLRRDAGRHRVRYSGRAMDEFRRGYNNGFDAVMFSRRR